MSPRTHALVQGGGSNLIAWGYYVVTVIPEAPTPGASEPAAAGSSLCTEAIVPRATATRAFWACWHRGDPRRDPMLAEQPDDFGFVLGPRAQDDAIGAAYNALREGRGERVHDVSIGEDFARRAYREGAPQRRSRGTDFEVLAELGFQELGLDPKTATPGDVRRAFLAAHPDHGGDPATDMDRLTKLFSAALAAAKKRVQAASRAAEIAGTAGPRPKRKAPKASPLAGELPINTALGRDLDRAHLLREVRQIAKRVRARAETVALVLGEEANLSGMCGVAALGLVDALTAMGIRARVGGGRAKSIGGHYWAEVPLPDELGADPGFLIVDVTATQMGASWPPVLVLPPGAKRREAYERVAGGGYVVEHLRGAKFVKDKLARLPEDWWR